MSLDRQEPYRARHLVWPWASNQSGAATGTHLAWPRCRGTYRCKVSLPQRPLADTPRIIRRRRAGGGISCAEGDSGPPGTGREPSWARPCEASGALLLSNGGTGGGHAACTLWPPPAPFGYFPARGKYLVRPQAGETYHKRQVSCGGKGKSLSFFLFLFLRGFRLCGGDQRAFRSPFGNLRSPCCGWKFSQGMRCFLALPVSQGFASAEATKGLSGRPLETFGPLAADGNFHKKWIVPSHQSTAKSVPVRRFRLPGTLLFSRSSSATQRP